MAIQFSAEQIAHILGGRVEGDASVLVHDFAKIEEATEGKLTFLANLKYEPFVYTTQASIVLVKDDFTPRSPISATLIHVSDPYAALASLMQLVEAQTRHTPVGIHERAVVSEEAILGEGVYIGAGAVVEAGASIGDKSQIYPNAYVGRGSTVGAGCIVYPSVVIYHGVRIGDRCVIHAGAVIGADGFGFAPQLDGYHKIPQMGNVIIEDDVEIGANTCIDRAVMGSTVIRRGVKLDNLVQIAHNCEVGPHTVMAAQVGMAGSSSIGAWCQAGGQVGIAGHLKVGDRVQMGGQTGILGNIESDRVILGSPAMEASTAMRSYAVLAKLPDMYRQLGRIEKELDKIKKQEHNG